VNSNVASALLAVIGELEGNRVRTTTLSVLDGGPALGAFRSLLASGAVLHAIVEFDLGVNGNRHIEMINGEAPLGARYVRAAALVLANGTLNALWLECAFGQTITFAEGALAGEAREVKVSVGTDDLTRV
jgi:hypothetical protein